MPGTILSIESGLPTKIPKGSYGRSFSQTFPNRLLKNYLATRAWSPLVQDPTGPSSMEEIRQAIEEAISPINSMALSRIDGDPKRLGYYKLPALSRTHIRKMLSRYWNNISPFALDLASAVHRQGIFTDKMYQVCDPLLAEAPMAMAITYKKQIDWIHSPAATETMSRLIAKFDRFTHIMAAHPNHVAVPTLDVDLAWVSVHNNNNPSYSVKFGKLTAIRDSIPTN